MDSAVNEFNNWMVTLARSANTRRLEMAAGAVGDDAILDVWQKFADGEYRINEIRRLPDFHDEYSRYRGLAHTFNCTDDVNAATDKINGLPARHKFKTDHRVDFRIKEGALPGGLSENTNYFVRTVDSANGTVTLTAAEGGSSDIDLTNATGNAEMLLNIKPDLSNLLTAIDAVLDEIELNLTQRGVTYDRVNQETDYSTRDTTATSTLRTKLLDVENLIDTTPV